MRDLMKIGEIANLFDVSTRTVRYYEEVGLLTSHRDPDSQYRYYDEGSSQHWICLFLLKNKFNHAIMKHSISNEQR